MFGSQEEYKDAKKQIEKMWHSNHRGFKKSVPIMLEYLPRFDDIKNPENQAAFCSGLSLFYLTLGDDYFDELKKFTLKVLQHPHGSVREAIRKTSEWLFATLTNRIEPFMFPEDKKLSIKQKAAKIVATMQYLKFVKELEDLIDWYDDGSDEAEYISEMKPSISKSLQLYWSRLTEGSVYQKILEQSHKVPHHILVKRTEIERDLSRLLKLTRSDFGLELVKDIIFNEQGHDDLTSAIAIFDTGIAGSELENILEILSDAWNYFPHRSLGGLSPAEKVLEK